MEETNYYNQQQEQEDNRCGLFKKLLLWDFFTDGDILGIFK